MRLAGITRDTQPPDGGTIVKDAAGEPTGLFKDNAMDLITRAIPPASLDQTIDKARAALKHAASLGVTTIQDMTASATELRAYNALRASGELTARIYSIQNHGIEGLIEAGIATGFGDDWIRIGGQQVVRRRIDGLRHRGLLRALYRRSVDQRLADSHARSPREGDLCRRRRRLPGDRARHRRSREPDRARCLRKASARARTTGPARANRARSGRYRQRQAAIQGARRHRFDPAEPLHRRHAVGGEADR